MTILFSILVAVCLGLVLGELLIFMFEHPKLSFAIIIAIAVYYFMTKG